MHRMNYTVYRKCPVIDYFDLLVQLYTTELELKREIRSNGSLDDGLRLVSRNGGARKLMLFVGTSDTITRKIMKSLVEHQGVIFREFYRRWQVLGLVLEQSSSLLFMTVRLYVQKL